MLNCVQRLEMFHDLLGNPSVVYPIGAKMNLLAEPALTRHVVNHAFGAYICPLQL